MIDEGERGREQRARGIADQIFVVSAAMVGVCLTLMGLVAIVDSLSPLATLTDELLAADAMFFLVACLSAYLSLRTASAAQRRRYETVADTSFIVAMVALVGIGAVVALRLF